MIDVQTSKLAFETEQEFLGCLLYDGELIYDTTIKPIVFYTMAHKLIYEAMLEVKKSEEALDVMTLVHAMGESGLEKLQKTLSDGTPISYLTEIASAVATTANFKFLERKLLENWKVRKSQEIALEYAENPDLETLARMTKSLVTIEEAGDKATISNSERLRRIYARMEAGKQGDVTGYDTGFNDLNRMTEGFQRKQFTIIAARPSVGKTALMLNLIKNGLDKDTNSHHTVFSLEMSAEQLLERMAGFIAKIPASAIKARTLTDEQWTKFSEAMAWLSEANLTIIDDTGLTTSEMRSKMRAVMREFPERNHIMYADYLTIIRPDNRNIPRTLQVGQIGEDLKIMAKTMDIPVICLAQLSRSVESRQDKRPTMSDIRDSGEIEQIADMIICLYREDYYDAETEDKNVIELIIDKQRDGATGVVKLAFVKEFGLYASIAWGE